MLHQLRPIPGICTKFVECFKVIIMLMMITRGISVNDSVPACCRGGVGFESDPHCVILEMLKIVPIASMAAT